MSQANGAGPGPDIGFAVVKRRGEEDSLVAPAAWASVTLALTVVSLTLDPDWAYFGAWAAGLMTAYAVIARAIRMDRRRRLDSVDEALRLEVRKAKSEEREGKEKERLQDEAEHRPPPADR